MARVEGSPERQAQDMRRVINEVMDETAATPQFRKLIKDLMSVRTLKWGFCPSCRKKVQVDYPDYKGQRDLLVGLLDQGKGKPRETQVIELSHAVRAQADLEALSDEELRKVLELTAAREA